MKEIKASSSKWIKTKGIQYQKFAWQDGYAVFSVSSSKKNVVEQYISKQKEHHKKDNFQEELILFLKEYNVEYSEEYLWQ